MVRPEYSQGTARGNSWGADIGTDAVLIDSVLTGYSAGQCVLTRYSAGRCELTGYSADKCVLMRNRLFGSACGCVCSRLRSRPCQHQRLPSGLRQDHRRHGVSSRGGGPREDVRWQRGAGAPPERLLRRHRRRQSLLQPQRARRRCLGRTAGVQSHRCAVPTAASCTPTGSPWAEYLVECRGSADCRVSTPRVPSTL